jgi:hypothetical protein
MPEHRISNEPMQSDHAGSKRVVLTCVLELVADSGGKGRHVCVGPQGNTVQVDVLRSVRLRAHVGIRELIPARDFLSGRPPERLGPSLCSQPLHDPAASAFGSDLSVRECRVPLGVKSLSPATELGC